MSEERVGEPEPIQFDKADFAEARPTQVPCTGCGRAITDSYFEANGKVVCQRCRARLVWERTGGSGVGRLLRASVFGLLAAALGSGIYYAVSALTGYEFGLIAIVVGLMVGMAVRVGSRGRGGWRYQALAMFLTYASIVSTYIPQIVQAVWQQAQPSESRPGAATEPVSTSPAPRPTNRPSPTPSPEMSVGQGLLALGLVTVLVFALAFAAPFLGGIQNILGIVIIGIGLYEAWKINRRSELDISGPFRLGAAAPSPHA